jgi:tripartite-type tricarboxylate transporter receptor subunit TctC
MLAGAAALPFAAAPAIAQRAYPERPIRLIVPFGPGTGTDTVARQLSSGTQAFLGQPVVVENRAGGNAIIGSEAAARSAPDGYTLMFGTTQALCYNPVMYQRLPYDPVRDFAPVAGLVSLSYLLVVTASLPIRSVPELVAHAKANPGQLTFGSTGAGTGSRLIAEVFAKKAGIEITNVSYQGGAGQLFTDLITGRISMIFYPYQFVRGHLEAGRMRALATTDDSRVDWLPDVPTLTELGFSEAIYTTWFAIYAPAGMPEDRIARVSEAYRRVLEAPELRATLAADGTRVAYRPPADLAVFVERERDRCREVVTLSGARVE